MNRILVAALGLALAAGAARAENPVVVIDTTLGPIKVELDQDKAPTTVKNFLDYVDEKFYDNTVFHRVIPGFMAQGGGYQTGVDRVRTKDQFDAKEKKTKPPIKNEGGNGLQNKRGTIAMARTPAPDSATAQFFINVADNAALDRPNSRDRAGYAVFGKVIDGMDVVDKIVASKTHAIQTIQGPMKDIPNEDVVIRSIRRDK